MSATSSRFGVGLALVAGLGACRGSKRVPDAAVVPDAALVTLVPLVAATGDVRELTWWRMPSGSHVIAYGRTAGAIVRIALAAGHAPGYASVVDGTERSVSDLTWAMTVDDRRATVGSAGPTGALTASQATAEYESFAPDYPEVLALTGTAAHGFGVVQRVGYVQLAHMTSHALSLDDQYARDSQVFVANDGITRVVAAWWADGKVTGEVADGDSVAVQQLEFPSAGEVTAGCFTRKRLWLHLGFGALAVGVTGPLALADAKHRDLLACGDGAAVLHGYGPEPYRVCPDDAGLECQPVAIPNAPPTGLVTVAGDQLVAVWPSARELRVWTEHAGFRTFPIATELRPLFLLATATTLDVVGDTDAGVQIARVVL